jgi:hypothetical protein
MGISVEDATGWGDWRAAAWRKRQVNWSKFVQNKIKPLDGGDAAAALARGAGLWLVEAGLWIRQRRRKGRPDSQSSSR